MDDLDRINDLIRAARANWFGLLAYLAFAGVTLMGVRDADFFIVERETTLPLIGVDIPTFLFFWVAPGLGAALYAYLHLNLLRLWEALGEHRRNSGEPGTPLVNRTVPWLVVDHALAGSGDGAPRGRPMRGLADLVTWALTYAAAPLVLALFFWRSMPAHNEALTIFGCALPLWVALYAGLTSARHRRACLSGRPARFAGLHRAALWLLGLGLPLLGWFTTEGTLDRYAREWFDLSDDQIADLPFRGTDALLVPAQLARVDFVDIPADWRDFDTARKAYRVTWCRDRGLPPAICGPVRPDPGRRAALDHRRQTWCADHLPARAGNGEPSLTGRCTDRFAAYDTEFAGDWQTERAALLATLTPRSFSNRDFRGADLRGARLEGAILDGARLERAHLRGARLEGAKLREARLEGAILWRARLEGANLLGVRLEETDLREARLEGAILWRADLRSASWAGVTKNATTAHFADFRGGRDMTQAGLSTLIGNAATLLPDTPDTETAAPLHVCSCCDPDAPDPPGLDHLIALFALYGISEADLRDPEGGGFFCAAGEMPRKTGTPWPLDAPPPWGARGTDESEDDYDRRRSAWAEAQPAGAPCPPP